MLFFFYIPWGRQPRLHSLQAVGVRWAGCCVSVCGKAARSLSRLSAQSGFVPQRRGAGSRHCSLGHCPDPVCLSVYLSVFVCRLVRPPFVSPRCCGGALRPRHICPAARPQKWHGFGAFGRWLHTHFIISVNIPSYGPVGALSALVRAAEELPDWCPINKNFCFKDLFRPTGDSFLILFTIKGRLEPR